MSEGLRHSLLDEEMFTTSLPTGRKRLTLPGVLAALQAGEVGAFDGLRAHQEQAWFCFLVQSAAMATEGEDAAGPHDEAAWRRRLVGLTDGDTGAWSLVVEDPLAPAFLQPPTVSGAPAWKETEETPDALDMLVTSKNHDLKAARMRRARPEHWAYALVALQTLEGFGGRSNYGIARMNSGFGSRPMVAWAPSIGWSARFRSDLDVLRASISALRTDRAIEDGAHRTLWTLPWNGETSLRLTAVHPYAVEVCRRVRLEDRGGDLVALRVGTNAPRIEAKEALGNVGDPWIPIVKGGKALTVQSKGVDARMLVDLLFEQEVVHGVAGDPSRRIEDGWFVAIATARGQGGTDGHHQRWLPVPRKARGLLGDRARRETLGQRARERLKAVEQVRSKVLYPSLMKLLSAGSDDRSRSDFAPDRWTGAFQAAADARFFPELWAAVDAEDDAAAEGVWRRQLVDLARAELERAFVGAPVASTRRYRAISAAEGVFAGAAKKLLAENDPGRTP